MPQVICALPRHDFGGTTVNADGVVLVGDANGPINRVPLSGGTPEPVSALDAGRGEFGQVRPFLPDGKHYLFGSRSARPTAMVGTLGSSQRVELLADVGYAAYVPPGLIVFWRDSRMMAQRFDAARLRLDGRGAARGPSAHPDRHRVFHWHARYRAQLSGPVRRHGEITAGNARLAWLDRSGRVVEVLTPLGGHFNPRVSPDVQAHDRRRAVRQRERGRFLWTIDVRRKLGTRLTFDPRRDSDAVWAPGGDRLAWT